MTGKSEVQLLSPDGHNWGLQIHWGPHFQCQVATNSTDHQCRHPKVASLANFYSHQTPSWSPRTTSRRLLHHPAWDPTMETMLPVEMTRENVSNYSLKHVTDDWGETYEALFAGLHWGALLVKWRYHNPIPIARDLARWKREDQTLYNGWATIKVKSFIN